MNSDRPYRETPGFDKACQELEKFKSSRYDPEIVEACLKLAENNRFDFLKNSN